MKTKILTFLIATLAIMGALSIIASAANATATQLNITISPTNATIYAGQNITFTNITAGGTPPYHNYSYSVKGIPTNFTIENNTITFPYVGNYLVFERVEDSSVNQSLNAFNNTFSAPAYITVLNATNTTTVNTTTTTSTIPSGGSGGQGAGGYCNPYPDCTYQGLGGSSNASQAGTNATTTPTSTILPSIVPPKKANTTTATSTIPAKKPPIQGPPATSKPTSTISSNIPSNSIGKPAGKGLSETDWLVIIGVIVLIIIIALVYVYAIPKG